MAIPHESKKWPLHPVLLPEPNQVRPVFSDGTPDGATRFNGIMERERTALTALQPHWDRNLD
jgi:hypothetical protein